MLLSSKILPVLALVAALAPLAANAAPVLAPLNHHDPVAPSGATLDDPAISCSYGHPRMFLIQPSPAKYDVAPPHHDPVMPSGAALDNPTAIYSGKPAPMFPISEGG
jgi:hypothetical protein